MSMSPRLLRPRATGFNPKNIAGLQLWLDAADSSTVTLNGSTVSEWRSKVNSYAVSQSTAANQPTYETAAKNGKNAMKFDGSNDQLAGAATSSLFASAATLLIAFRPNSDSSYVLTTTGTAVNPFARFSGDGLTYENTFRSSRLEAINVGMPTNADGIYGIISSSANYRLFLNNVLKATQTAGFTTGNTFLVGSSFAHAGTAIDGWIYEIVGYNVALSTLELTRVHNYLQQKWGMVLS